MRYPPVSRLQKIHNCEVGLEALKALQGAISKSTTSAAADAREIVDGQRHKTLSLAWQVISRMSIPELQNLPPLNFDPNDDGRGKKPEVTHAYTHSRARTLFYFRKKPEVTQHTYTHAHISLLPLSFTPW